LGIFLKNQGDKAVLKTSLKFLAFGSAMLVATPSFALVDVQALAGKRSGEFKMKDADAQKLDGTEVTAAVHLDPIPLVPVAFGASFHLQTWDKDKLEVKSVESSLLNLEVMAWIPGVPVITPYAKAGYTIVGAMHMKDDVDLGAGSQELDLLYKVSGYNLTVGVNYPVIPLIGIIAEVDMGSHTITPDKIKLAGTELDSAAYKSTSSTTAFRLGIQVGL